MLHEIPTRMRDRAWVVRLDQTGRAAATAICRHDSYLTLDIQRPVRLTMESILFKSGYKNATTVTNLLTGREQRNAGPWSRKEDPKNVPTGATVSLATFTHWLR